MPWFRSGKRNQPAPVDPLDGLQPGYPKLAGRMSILPETAMFKRFGALNARNLLYMQSELMVLERRLRNVEIEDATTPKSSKKLYARDYYCLQDSEYAGPDTKQLNLVKKMREVLKEYNNALIQQHTICQMKGPSRIDLDNIQNYIASMQSPFLGVDYNVWGSILDPEDYDKELVVLQPREGTDIFSRWLGRRALKYLTTLGCARFKRVKPKFGSIAVMDENVYKFTFACTSVIASLFPVLSIIVLILLHSVKQRVVVIAVFNVAISLLLTMFTEAKRTDVFAVTAAFAAVQVVFVGQALDDGPQEVMIAPNSSLPNGTCSC